MHSRAMKLVLTGPPWDEWLGDILLLCLTGVLKECLNFSWPTSKILGWKNCSGTLPQWQFLQDFQSVTERKKKGQR